MAAKTCWWVQEGCFGLAFDKSFGRTEFSGITSVVPSVGFIT
jgi:hypothetical protein